MGKNLDMDMPKLERCPHCGGKAHIQGRGHETNDYRVYCKECSCSTQMWLQSKEKAIAAWNRRATLLDNCVNSDCPYMRGNPCIAADGCGGFTPDNKTMTNADRIRAMSDDELCEMAWSENWTWPEFSTKEDLSDWFSQPAEED